MAARLLRLFVVLVLTVGAVVPSPGAAAVVRIPTSHDTVTSVAPARGAEAAYARSYFGARYYRATAGRFTTIDPAYTWQETLADPQRWNRYAYVRNNPLRYVDPDGKVPVPLLVTGAIGAAVYGGWAIYQNVSHGQPWSNNVGVEASKGFLVGATLGLAAPSMATATASLRVVTATAGLSEGVVIRFGGNASQLDHAFRHTDRAGLERAVVAEAITKTVAAVGKSLEVGTLHTATVEIGGTKVTYNAYKLADGTINVGRTTLAK